VPYVAVVDDEEPVRKALRRLLRAAGLQADSYASGQEFLDAAGRLLPIVIITAHDEPATREQCLAAGATAFLRKPLDERLLLNAISAALSLGAHARR
jgi:FixJ family two-component response regulator